MSATTVTPLAANDRAISRDSAASSIGRITVVAGRALFAAIFLMGLVSHFSAQAVGYAAQQGVPMAGFLVPASGVLAFAGGLSILLGLRAKLGAWLLVLFLVPVTLTMHAFWAIKDPMMAQMQFAMFMKNLSMLGGALIITQLGAGPASFDAARDSRRSRVGAWR